MGHEVMMDGRHLYLGSQLAPMESHGIWCLGVELTRLTRPPVLARAAFPLYLPTWILLFCRARAMTLFRAWSD